jgi:hypothetical protein
MDSPGGKFVWSAGGTHLYAPHRLQGLRPCPWTGATAKPNLPSLPSRRKVKDVLLLALIRIPTSAPQSVKLVLTVLSLGCVLIWWFTYTYHPLS